MVSPLLRQALGYRKFATAQKRIIVLDSGYHAQADCRRALTCLGHLATPLTIPKNATPASVAAALLHEVVRQHPDFILAINHIGFDAEGALGALLDDLAIPVAVWYVDSPFFVLRQGALPAAQMSTLFLWDRAYLPLVERLGASDAHYLPLACDPQRLHAAAAPKRWPASFVGDSMAHAQRLWRRRVTASQRRQAATLSAALLHRRAVLLEHLGREDSDVLALATFCATASYRARLLRHIGAGTALHLFGDPGWVSVVPRAQHHPPVDYGSSLAQTYLTSQVNINATSLQMPTAVNQRVFDVPAAGGFLLTDNQADTTEHFEPHHEVAIYSSDDELRDKTAYYIAHPVAAEAIVQAARRRINQQHTYGHRLQRMLETMRQRHAPVHARAL